MWLLRHFCLFVFFKHAENHYALWMCLAWGPPMLQCHLKDCVLPKCTRLWIVRGTLSSSSVGVNPMQCAHKFFIENTIVDIANCNGNWIWRRQAGREGARRGGADYHDSYCSVKLFVKSRSTTDPPNCKHCIALNWFNCSSFMLLIGVILREWQY